jgi:predicted glycoside hydrolase/deacetylase ChbG (UPF0249 family)
MCTSDWTCNNSTVESFAKMLEETLPLVGSGVLEICTHPGFCDDELIRSSSWNAVRESDYHVLKWIAVNDWLKTNNISLDRFENSSARGIASRAT